MKINILLISALVLLAYACGGNCAEENAKLKDQIAEYEQQEQLTALAMNDYDAQIKEYKTKDDSLKMFRDSIDIMTNKMRSSGKASAGDNKAMNKYVNEMRRILAENKKLTADLSQYVDSADIGENPALVVKVLAQNLETKEREIADLQKQIEELQKEVKGLKVELTVIAEEKQNLETVNQDLSNKNEELTEEVKVLKISKITNAIFNKNGKDITDNKVKLYNSISTLEICYTLEKNKFAEVGNHNIYICIIKNGTILTNSSSNLFSAENGKQLGYTIKSNVNYKGELIRTCSKWEVGNNKIEKGSYEIIIYDEKGRKIGSDLFSL